MFGMLEEERTTEVVQCVLALGDLRASAHACVVPPSEAEDALAWAGTLVTERLESRAPADEQWSPEEVRDELLLLCEAATILAVACATYCVDDDVLAFARRRLEADLDNARDLLRFLDHRRAPYESAVVKVGVAASFDDEQALAG